MSINAQHDNSRVRGDYSDTLLANPENIDLLSPSCPVRAIITKQALQEGWDCSFAYVLCSLSASKNLGALTQLVGRIIRQPNAKRTGIQLLDECYVFCHHGETAAVVDSIKSSLEQDGMSDLVQQIRTVEGGTTGASRKVKRRQVFKDVQIFLPVVNWVEGGVVRALDYEQDVLSGIDWLSLSTRELAQQIPLDGSHARVSQITRVSLAAGEGASAFMTEVAVKVDDTAAVLDAVYSTRMLTDVLPNPWIARALVTELVDGLRARGATDDTIGALSGFILETTRRFLTTERDRLAEEVFMSEVAAERIQFRLRADRHNWEMPHEMETDLPENAEQLPRNDGGPMARSVFAPIYRADFNKAEAEFACYLDEPAALTWWHRNVAKAGHYHLQGWKRNRVYPDFLFALTQNNGKQQLVVMEMKGDQLAGNLDTEYKRRLLSVVNDSFQLEKTAKAGELELVVDENTSVSCDLVLMTEWKLKVPAYFAAASGSQSL